MNAQTSYTWNGAASSAWNTPANWTPNGVPGALDNATIVTGSNNCVLNASTSVGNLTLTSGTLNLGSYTLTVNGSNAVFTSGTVLNGVLTVPGANSTTFNGGIFNCTVGVTSGTLTLKNTTFQGTTNLAKSGATNDYSGGNNIFSGVLTVTNNGTGVLALGNGNPDQFNGASTFINTSASNLYVAYNSTGNTFNGVTTFNNSPSTNNGVYVSWNSTGTVFNNSIVVNSSAGTGVQFCGGNGTATATLAAGQTITAGSFTAGTLLLRQFTQAGTTAQTLSLTGALTFGPASTFGGNVTSTSGALLLNGCTFNGTTNLTKTGGTGDGGTGGNTFNGACSITNSGTNYLVLGNNNPDTWNNSATFTDNGSDRLLPCWGSAGNQFNGNIYTNTSGSASGIEFCGGNATATATMASGYSIFPGSGGLTAGYLYLRQFTQVGSTPINLTSTGTSTVYLGPSSSFGGAVSVTAPDIYAQGAIYNSAATFTKTGGSSDNNNSKQNIFNSTCTINQQSSTGSFMLGNNSNDLFNGNIIVSSTGSSGIYLGGNGGTGTPTLAAGYTISVGPAGFSGGFLSLNTFTQLGTAPINLTFTGTSTGLYFARGSVIGGNVTSSTPDLYFNGCTFNGTVNATKTGSSGDSGGGGDIFNGVCTVTNNGGNYLLMGNGSPDTWNDSANFTSNGSSYIGLAYNSVGNQLNGNTTFSSFGSSTGVYFCQNSASTVTLASGQAIQIGTGGFSSGTLSLKQFTQAGNATSNLLLTGATTLLQVGPSSSIGGNFIVVSPRILLNGAVYSDSVNVTKTGATGEWSSGGNTFNSTLTVNQQGSGYFGFASGSPDIYNGDVYANNNSTERIIFGNTPVGNQFNGNIILTQVGSSVGIAFGWSANTNETLAAGKTISIGAAGFSTGYLQIERFTQLGNTPVNLPLTGTSSLTFGPTSSFGGNVTSTSGSLLLNGCTFNGVSVLTKTGSTGDGGQGGNVFNAPCTITNSGSNYLVLGNNTPDTWNSSATFTDNGSDRLLPAWGSAGNQFNGNIYVNTAGSASGIQFCGGNTTASATLAAGQTISAGSFSAGYLILRQFTQLGNADINLTLSSTATYLQFGPSSSIGGSVISSSPGLFFNGCTFSDSVTCVKTGASSDASAGNNIFNGITNVTNAGTGNLYFGNGSSDQFNDTATFNNTGGANLYVAYNSPGNTFNGLTTFNNSPSSNNGIYVSWNSAGTVFNSNVAVNSSAGTGVQFCGGNTTASATLAAGQTVSAGTFSAGTLLLRQFTQAGGTAQTLSLTGAGNLTFGPSSAFGGNVTSTSGALLFNGCNFSGTVTSLKTGPSNDGSTGNNNFGGAFTVTNTGSGYLSLGNGNPDVWQSTATFNNLSTAQHMYVANNSSGNTFNGPVLFNNQPGAANLWIYANANGSNTLYNATIAVQNVGGAGVYFGSGGGTATLSSGNIVTIGSAGFASGGLILRNFTQAGSGTPQSFTTTGTSYIQYGPGSLFGSSLTSFSPGLLFNGATFNGTVNCTKTGTSSDQSQGSNTFNATSVLTDNGSGYLLMTLTNPDTYNGNMTFVQSGTGVVYPNYNGNSNYLSNVTVTSPGSMTFGAGTGTATFSGSGTQSISGSAAPTFTRLVIANLGGGVTLNTSVNVSSVLTMSSGLLNTSTANILTMLNGSTATAATALSTSYVNGPMRYQKSTTGPSTLNFPIGAGADCRPFILTVNHATNTLYTYTAQLFNASAAALNYTLPASVTNVSAVHYYTIARTDASGTSQPIAGLSGNQTIQVFFGNDDAVSDGTNLVIVKNTYTAPTAWINIGGTGGPSPTGGNLTGSITSTSSPTAFNSFSTFALANPIGGGNVLPVGVTLNAFASGKEVSLDWMTSSESGDAYFTIERSKDGITFDSLSSVSTAALDGNSSTPLQYTGIDPNPFPGNSYYRIRQTHQDGYSVYSSVVMVNFSGTLQSVSVYPNPTSGPVTISGIAYASMSLEWLDMGGRSMGVQTLPVSSGTVHLNINFINGIYFLKMVFPDGSVKVQKVILLR